MGVVAPEKSGKSPFGEDFDDNGRGWTPRALPATTKRAAEHHFLMGAPMNLHGRTGDELAECQLDPDFGDRRRNAGSQTDPRHRDGCPGQPCAPDRDLRRFGLDNRVNPSIGRLAFLKPAPAARTP